MIRNVADVVGKFLGVILAIASLQVFAEGQLSGSDFNHMTTGFVLSGGHAVAACETCHVGGIFKGTPKTCDGCHALGKRILATPKSNAHVVTSAACESCHFNTATWLGARYNHGTAVPGQCVTCHNGRIAQGKTSSVKHNSVLGQSACDSCHRTSAWLVTGYWNHTNNALYTYSGQSCVNCHSATGIASEKIQSASHMPLSMGGLTFPDCRSCHTNYASFYAARYDHAGATACTTCHNGAYSGVKGKTAGRHVMYTGTPECSACHSTTSWRSALPSVTLHTSYFVGQTCQTCHASNSPISGGKKDDEHGGRFNAGVPDCSSAGCHRPLGTKGSAYSNWD